MRDLKTDSKREEIIFGETKDWENSLGGIYRFDKENALDPETLEKLVVEGYADPNEQQNASPEIQELLNFGKEIEAIFDVQVKYEGYVVSPNRRDARVSIDTILVEGKDIPDEVKDAFRTEFRRADSYSESDEELFAWWD
jgi:hypothetical protein